MPHIFTYSTKRPVYAFFIHHFEQLIKSSCNIVKKIIYYFNIKGTLPSCCDKSNLNTPNIIIITTCNSYWTYCIIFINCNFDVLFSDLCSEFALKGHSFLFIQTVYEGQELNHPFGLCHYKNFLFWNEYRGGGIYKLDQNTKKATLLRNERPPIYEIRTYDAQQQQSTEHPELFLKN